MTIVHSKREDLKKIALCHRSAFPRSLSSKMGVKYLTKMIEWYLSDEKKFLFHLEADGQCVGYCGGMVNDETQRMGSASGMFQYSFNEALKSIALRPWLIFHKELISKYKLIIKNIKMRFKNDRKIIVQNPINTKGQKQEPVTGLVVIGVSLIHQGKGYGSILLKEFENKTRHLNIHKMALTVKSSNQQAINSYERNGWMIDKKKENYLEMIKII